MDIASSVALAPDSFTTSRSFHLFTKSQAFQSLLISVDVKVVIKYGGQFGSTTGQKGYCVTSTGRDQNSGVKKLNNLDINTNERRMECLGLCSQVKGATACEGIWSQGNRGCYAHTQPVARGNGRDRHICWTKTVAPEPYKPIYGETFMGCYKDAGNRDLPNLMRAGYGNPSKCFKMAMDAGY
jgi:hypothetical protein